MAKSLVTPMGEGGKVSLREFHDSDRWMHRAGVAGLAAALICVSAGAAETDLPLGAKEKTLMPMTITSTAFLHNGVVPARHTCDGQDISPQLNWTAPPEGTKSLVLIVDDPDAPDPAAPRMTWVHWVLYNLPPNTTGLPEGVAAKDLPSATLQGMNDWQRTGYGGPCPPVGSHRYFHKLFALDAMLPDLKHPTKAVLEKAMQGHVLAHSALIGTYQRRR